MTAILKEVTKAKIDVRQSSRDLIQTVFKITEHTSTEDKGVYRLQIRKKALSISSFISHGTSQTTKEEQGQQFLAVMSELRELLKLITEAKDKNVINESHKTVIKMAISNVINTLNSLVKLTGVFD